MPTEDLDVYKLIGEIGTETTGYPCVSVYHGFRYHPKKIMHGAMDDYCFKLARNVRETQPFYPRRCFTVSLSEYQQADSIQAE